MALTDESNGNGFYMPVAPAYGVGGNGNGNGFGWGGDWAWIILLLLLGWGNNGWGNGGFGGGYGNDIYPWMNQANLTSNGFQNQMLNDNITGIRDSISALAMQLCNCCGDVQMALANGFAGVEAGANARQIANMQQAFASQTALTQGMNDIGMSLQNCCCENRANIADLKYTVATENCADRQVVSDGIRDLLANQTANTQKILDQLCAERIERKDDEIANLRQQIAMKDLAASQVAQNAFISQGFSNEVDQLYSRLNSCPIPSTPVFGRTPIFTCNQNSCGCGCGGNGF